MPANDGRPRSPHATDRCMRGMGPIIRTNGAVEIPLTQGQVALVDAISYSLIADKLWYAWWSRSSNSFYGMTNVRIGTRRTAVYMHRILVEGAEIDHADGDSLNNVRDNLRQATRSGNNANSKPRGGVSRYKGVSLQSKSRRWRARVARHHLGTFDTEELAAIAYDKASRALFGEFARTNF